MALILPSDSKIAVIVAPNGARKTKDDHPNLPINEHEIIEEVIACRDAGAAMVHLHARDGSGQHTLAIDENLQLLEAVTAEVGDSIIVQLTTEAVGKYTATEQMTLIRETRPEAASFSLRELIPYDSGYQSARDFFHWLVEENIISQIILYDQHDVQRYFRLRHEQVLPKEMQHALMVLGRYQEHSLPSPWNLRDVQLERFVNERVRCAMCAFGDQEQACLVSAMLLGIDVRVGFENNLLNTFGNLAQSNAEQVSRLRDVSERLNIQWHDAASFRLALTNDVIE